MTRLALRILQIAASALSLGFIVPVLAQTGGKTYTGVCEDVLVPDYPRPGDPGVAIEDFGLIPYELFDKSVADCAARGTAPLADDKLQVANVRLQALAGDRKTLPRLRKLAEGGLVEADFLISRVFVTSMPVSPASPDAGVLKRAEAEQRLRKAASEGHHAAIADLAHILTMGSLVRRDDAEARVWLEKMLAEPTTRAVPQAGAAIDLAALIQDDAQASAADLKRIPALQAIAMETPATSGYAKWLEVRGLRLGRGWEKDDAKARAMAEAPGLMDQTPAVRAEYIEILKASSQADDKVKLAEILESAKPARSRTYDSIVGEMLLSGVPAGRDRKRALDFLMSFASYGHEQAIAQANRVVEAGNDIKIPTGMMRRLFEAVDLGLPGADVALTRLRLSNNSDAEDYAEALALQAMYAARSDDMALLVLERIAETGPQDFYPQFTTKEKSVAALEKLIASGRLEAWRIKAQALRRGTLYAQDDVEATALLTKAAEAGDVPAMNLLAKAYDEGLGIAESSAEEFRWKTAAAKAGSFDAARELIFFMPFRSSYPGFSVHDALVSGLVLYADGLSYLDLPSGYDSVFRGQDLDKIGADAVARGVMDGFRASVAARNDEFIVRFAKRLPEEVKRAIEAVLKQDGYLADEPDGYMRPAARSALIMWARAKGLPSMEADQPPLPPDADARLNGVPVIAPEVIAEIRAKAFAAVAAAKGKKAQKKAMQLVALLAQYGDLATRVEVLKRFSDSAPLRAAVPPGLAVVYGMDVVVSDPPDAEKAPFDFVFMVSNMYQQGSLPIAVDVLFYTLRDDPRLGQPEAFDKLADQFIFIPGYCDQLAAQAGKNKVPGLEADACSPASRRALVAWAKAAGPIGAEAQIRKEAAEALQKQLK